MKKFFTILMLIIISFQLSAQCSLLYDGFESGSLLPNWLLGTGTYTRSVNGTTPGVGSFNFEQTGSSAFYQGTYSTFTSGQPGYISFWMRTNTTNAANGYLVIGDANITSDNGILFCYFNSTSGLRFYGTSGSNIPIVANQWYHVEAKNINWTSRTMDIYVNNVLELPSWPFRSATATSMDRIHLFNLNNATAMYDDILIGATPLVGSVTDTICIYDSVVVNGTTYNAGSPSGTEVYTNIGPNNCDSTVTVALNVLPALTGAINLAICEGDSIIVNGNVYDTTTTGAVEVFTNVGPAGCDSIVTINLTVNTINNTVIQSNDSLTANQTGATYQWIDCNNGDSAIVGETNQLFVATVNGDYAVIVTINGCTDTSACTTIIGIGINENNFFNDISIYPNPTNNLVNINLGEGSSSVNLNLTSIDGKVIYESNINTEKIVTINLNNNSKGVYFLRVSNDKNHKVFKVIKE
jgi:hypothetical protein